MDEILSVSYDELVSAGAIAACPHNRGGAYCPVCDEPEITEHEITVDEQPVDDVAYKAFCTCSWAGDWFHADRYVQVHPDDDDDWVNPEHPADQACNAAAEQGAEHLTEVAQP